MWYFDKKMNEHFFLTWISICHICSTFILNRTKRKKIDNINHLNLACATLCTDIGILFLIIISCNHMCFMPRLQAIVHVLRPCKPCRFYFLVCLGVCRRILTIFGIIEAEKYVLIDC